MDIDQFVVVAVDEVALHVEHIREAPGESRAEIHPGASQYADHAARHVFAAMIARALDHGESAGIAHCKPFTGGAGGVQRPARGAIQAGIAHDHRFARYKSRPRARAQHDLAGRHAFADVIVRFTFKMQMQAARIPDAETLSRGSLEIDDQRRRTHSRVAPALGNLAGYSRADRTMEVADGVREHAP